MDDLGFIRGKLDTKLLILYILDRLPAPVDGNTLMELTFCDNGVNYFEYIEALDELVTTDHVTRTDNTYRITGKGERNSREMETRIPYTVRLRAGKNASQIARVLSRNAMIRTGHSAREDGSFVVSLAMADGLGDIMKLELLSGTEDQAKTMEAKFRKNAESLYARIAALLLE